MFSALSLGGNPGEYEEGIRRIETQNKTLAAAKTFQAAGRAFAERKNLSTQSAAAKPGKGRSLETDRMLGELSPHNRAKALDLAQKLPAEDAANLYNLLLEHETTSKDPILHTLSKNLLVEYITRHPESITRDKAGIILHLNPDFYALYQKLSSESIGTEHARSLEEVIPFFRTSASTENVMVALSKAVGDFHAEISLPKPPKGVEINFSWLREGMTAAKIDLDRRTYVLAYIATSQSAQRLQGYSNFMTETNKLAILFKDKAILTTEEKTFMGIYRILEYRNSLSAAGKKLNGKLFLGSKISENEILAKLRGIKEQYYQTEFPFTQGEIKVQQTGANTTAKIRLDLSRLFNEQMSEAGKNWKLQIIINLAQKEGLPESFLNKFHDHGLALIQNFVYPELIKAYPEAASADELLSLLPANATDADKTELLLNTVRFMQEELRGAPIRKDQITEILSKMTNLGDKPTYIIQAAGKGKSTMARFAAKVLLKNVPFILFISPVRENRPGALRLTSLQELRDAIATNGKPQEFSVTPDDYARMLSSVSIEELEKLKNGLHIADEFDSDEYGEAHDILAKAGITRIANMSATDNDLRLINTLERKEAKLKDIIEELAQNPRQERLQRAKAVLEASIKEIKDNVQAEFKREMSVISEDYDPGQTKALAGQSVLLLHPDTTDADTLATSYVDKLKNSNAVILYRNNNGELKARIGSGSIDLKEFDENFDKAEPKPVVYCLYTKDSRGGDFGRFSKLNKNMQNIAEEHIFLKNFKSRNELYQFMRRLRREYGADLNNVKLVFHVPEGTTKEALLNRADELGVEAGKKLERTRLSDKVNRNMKQFIIRALNEKWMDVQAKLPGDNFEFKAYCNQETYQKAIQEVVTQLKLSLDSNPTVIYAEIQGRVNARFIELVNQQMIQADTKAMREQLQVLEKLTLQTIWSSGNKDQTFGEIWTRYLNKTLGQTLTSNLALKFGQELGILKNQQLENHKAPKGWSLKTPPGMFGSFIQLGSVKTKKTDLDKKIKAAEQNQTAFTRLKEIASTEATLKQLPDSLLNSKELRDVQFYQAQFNALELP